jgi:RNA polymerase sigma-70 factor, ECF subfamily
MAPSGPESDRDLVERARRDPEAFGELFERHVDAIFGYVLRRTGDGDSARDLTSETFLKALRCLPRYRWTGAPVSAWLYAIATNELRMYFRRGRRSPHSLDTLLGEAGFVLADPGTLDAARREAEAEQERHHEIARVREALLRLPLRDQEVIALRYFEKKSTAEVAAILDRPEGTVKSQLSRAIERLRGMLG